MAAREYIIEALSDEKDFAVKSVTVGEPDEYGQAEVRAELEYGGGSFSVTAAFGGTI